MRRARHVFPFITLLATALVTLAESADAGVIASENANPGFGGWPVQADGTANGAGVVDVYPASWSIAPGERIDLKVRSTSSYDVRILRLGWYGGSGARQLALLTGFGADPQPYPSTDGTFGLAEARWHTSVSLVADGSFTPGLYVARVERPDGYQAETFFTVRDDAQPSPILLVVSSNTHQAYNCWPGPSRSGKSLYGFNSSPTTPSADITGLTQAVKVSNDRPFFVGGGTADVSNYEYPFLRFLEKHGWDVGYATDQDIDQRPQILNGRRAVIFVGHSEYWTRAAYDHVLAARDAGTNFMFATGDTISWQVRYEAGLGGPTSTMVGYKESHIHDPEEKAGNSARIAGDIATARAHYRMVSRPWKTLAYYPDLGIDERRPGMLMTGVQSAGIIRDAAGAPKDYPWGDLVVTNSRHWLFAGTGMHYGDRIKGVMGYEVDSTLQGNTSFDPWRPAGQLRLASIKQSADDKIKGAVGYYQAPSGAEVVSFGAIAFSWALDDFAQQASYGGASSHDARAEQMVNNALGRWTGNKPAMMLLGHDESSELDPKAHLEDPLPDEVTAREDPSAKGSASGGGCALDRDGAANHGGALGVALGLGALAWVSRRRRARASTHG